MSSSKFKLNQLEGLRGIAALLVLLGHLKLIFFPNSKDVIFSYFGNTACIFLEAVTDGNFAVWLFWVMSAFVLSLRFFSSDDKTIQNSNLFDAAIRRYPRLLLPVLASILIAWVLHHFGLMSNAELAILLGPEDGEWFRSFYLFEPNFIYALKSAVWNTFFSFDILQTYNFPLWTMEIELYGSFFLFSILALFGKYQFRTQIYFAISFVLYLLSLHWLNAFVAGAVICDFYVHQNSILKGVRLKIFNHIIHSKKIAVLSAPPFLLLVGLPNFGWILHLLLATILTTFVLFNRPTRDLLSSRLPVFLGKISFGLYLAHAPIICATAYPIYSVLLRYLPPHYASIITSLVMIVESLAGGWLLWLVADRPAIKFSKYIASFLRARTAQLRPIYIYDKNNNSDLAL